ncbi:hypothetical protein ACFR9U_06085 [Halorientalis brevis]|uniref:Uncharacterized protein n=1 Tax=Halorientalis brevis TaxID=1126241 RepID=A0ABD6C878_9EURY|nr:hypothetical protein [Halorientalis brevis]
MAEDDALSVDEFVEYCQVQAGLLSGRVETMSDDLDDLLDELDAEMAEIRSQLDGRPDEVADTVGPPSATGPDESVDLDDLEAREADLEQKQALVEAKQARMLAFQELAADYTELAAELESDVSDGADALERVVRFEVERDAPAYFPDRQTVAEAAAASDEDA